MSKKSRNNKQPGIVRIPTNMLTPMTDARGNDATELLEMRLNWNLKHTGNPFHHKTLDGTIVEPDGTVEDMLVTMPLDDRDLVIERWNARIQPGAPEAVPLDRNFYDTPRGKAVMQRWLQSIE